MAKTRSGPDVSAEAISTPHTASHRQAAEGFLDSNAVNSGNKHPEIDRALLGEESLWVELFNGGRFRLAVMCDTCGRWLTAGKSKAVGRGPVCAAKAVDE